MLTAGIDCGAKNTKTIILKNGQIISQGSVPTDGDPGKAADQSLDKALKHVGIARGEIQKIYATGSGREAVKMADNWVNEIQAMSKGAYFFFPGARSVTDVGAEEGRAAKIDAKGNPIDFEINEQCAAGAGAFIEAMARALEVSIDEIGLLSLQSRQAIPMNAQCVVFAESEIVGLIHARTDRRDISKAIHDAMASRIASLIRRIGVHQDLVMLGGVARNPGFMAALQRELKVDHIYVPNEPQYGAAVGAAVLAAEEG